MIVGQDGRRDESFERKLYGGRGGVRWCGRPTHSLNHSPIRAEETREVLLAPFNRGEN